MDIKHNHILNSKIWWTNNILPFLCDLGLHVLVAPCSLLWGWNIAYYLFEQPEDNHEIQSHANKIHLIFNWLSYKRYPLKMLPSIIKAWQIDKLLSSFHTWKEWEYPLYYPNKRARINETCIKKLLEGQVVLTEAYQ